MRLFIAINFSSEVKNALSETIANLRQAALQGRFTSWDNLHLTLVFIGESNRVSDIVQIMQEVAERCFTEPFRIALSEAGVFGGSRSRGSNRSRRAGDLHWIGIAKNDALNNLVENLSHELKKAGLDIEKRRFVAHVTIGREVVLPEAATVFVQPAEMLADHISLMRSDRIDGQQVYTELAAVYCG